MVSDNPILSVFADVLRRQRVNPEAEAPECQRCHQWVDVTDMGPLGFPGVHCAPRLCEKCWDIEATAKQRKEDAKRFSDMCGSLGVPVDNRRVWLHDLSDTFDLAHWRESFREWLDEWPTNRAEGHGWVISSQSTGNGKTTIAQALATEVRQRWGGHVLFLRAEHFREAMTDSKRRHDARSVIGMADLLVIDDLGTERITSDGLTALSETFDELNAKRKPFIITKNESGEALVEAYKKVDQRALKLWARIADRWRDSRQVTFSGPSLRGPSKRAS